MFLGTKYKVVDELNTSAFFLYGFSFVIYTYKTNDKLKKLNDNKEKTLKDAVKC